MTPESARINVEVSEGEAEILALEAKLKQAREVQRLRGALENPPHDDIFVPDINPQPSNMNVIEDGDDDDQPDATPAKISPALKRKAASEAAKNERSNPTLLHTF